MQIIFFSSNIDIVDEWKKRHSVESSIYFDDLESLTRSLSTLDNYILIADFDSVASEINKMISSNTLPKNTIILEQVPEIITGKMLITHGIKAYGNSRMLALHFEQMLETVASNNVWTYPELTVALVNSTKQETLSPESLELIEHRLSDKEKEIVFTILEGLTNDAIAHKKGITTRTVKAHISSIFSKLHVNDRLALVLLLK